MSKGPLRAERRHGLEGTAKLKYIALIAMIVFSASARGPIRANFLEIAQ
jgi:hypothetical protein